MSSHQTSPCIGILKEIEERGDQETDGGDPLWKKLELAEVFSNRSEQMGKASRRLMLLMELQNILLFLLLWWW
jgi:hypothetical protein